MLIVEPRIFSDDRGYFYEVFNRDRFAENGITFDPVQDNESLSSKGVVRGLHYQLNPAAQAKLITVIRGTIYDVAADLRRGSSTFGKWFGITLDHKEKRQMYIPRGFAHGFSVLSDYAIIRYKCDNYYEPSLERSIDPFDSHMGIDWGIERGMATISDKDRVGIPFSEAEMNF